MIIQGLIILLGFLGIVVYGTATTHVSYASHKKYIIYMMILLTLQSGLRNVAVGSDTYSYYLQFIEVSNTSWDNLLDKIFLFFSEGVGKDPGYFFLLKIIQVFIPNYQLYLTALAAFFFFALGRLLYRYTNNNYEVLLGIALYQCLYYSFFSITGLRQTFATAFLLLAVPYVLDRKFIKFICLVIIASTQHKSALLFIPYYFLLISTKPKRNILISFAFFVQMWIIGKAFVSNMLSDTIFDQYSMFLEGNERAGANSYTIFILIVGLWILFSNTERLKASISNLIFINSIAVSIALTPLLKIDPSNMRLIQYYSVFSIILLPVLTTLTFNKKIRMMYILIILFLTYYTMSRNLEYAFFWQEMELGDNYK